MISLILLLCMLIACFPAGAEDAEKTVPEENPLQTEGWITDEEGVVWFPGEGYEFDFTLRLYPEAFSGSLQEHVRGYADLLEALRFKGTYTWALNGMSFELKLSVIPVSHSEGMVQLWLRGAEDLMFLSSNITGWKTLTLNNYSMLPFCAKMSEHLGVPLQYFALAYPYTRKSGLELPLQDWEYMTVREDENGVIPEDAVKYLWDCWFYRVNEDEPLKLLVDALCQDRDVEDAFRGFVYEIPDFFVKQVAQEKEIRILRGEGKTVWSTASGDLYVKTETEHGTSEELILPWMKTGYHPVYSFETFRENQSVSGRVRAQILGEESLQDLVNLEASIVALPETWPADCYSLLSLNLTGGLLPNVGLSCYLAGEKNGHAQIVVRKPTVGDEPGAKMLSIEGEMLPLLGDVLVRELRFEDAEGALPLFISNDAQINQFLPDLVQPMLEGMLQFLIGIPTSACQAVMDDLTDLGVFRVITGE